MLKIKLQDLVRYSDFARYYFVADARDFEPGTRLRKWIKLNGVECLFELCIEHPEEGAFGWGYYDLGKCLAYDERGKNAVTIARMLEKSDMFEFATMEHDKKTDSVYIHLRRK